MRRIANACKSRWRREAAVSCQNLSPALAARLAEVFSQSLHVRDAGLQRASDDEVWRFALDQGLAIVTKDSDFQERGQMAATAPGIVWIRRGNCSTAEIEALLRKHAARIALLPQDGAPGFLILL